MTKRRALLSFLVSGALLLAEKTVSDDQIYDLVRRKLANDPDVKGGALNIDVKDGTVTIRGTVETEKQKSKAERLAQKINGVKHVVNELQVVARTKR